MLLNPYRFGAGAPPLLLDTYSGAVAAYSVARKLKATAGLALRVRRSSDSVQQDIGFAGFGVDLSALTGFVGGVSGLVATLYDQVGVSHLANSTAGNQPRIIASGALNTQGTAGRPSMVLDSTDFLNTSTARPNFGTDLSLSGNVAWTAFIVHMKTTNAAGCLFGWGDSAVSLGAAGYYDDGASGEVAFSGGNSFKTSVPTNNTYYLTSICKSAGVISATTTAYRNGVSVAATGHSANTPNVAGNFPLALGRWDGFASNGLQGYAQEFILFAGDKSADRAAIEADINAFYGIY